MKAYVVRSTSSMLNWIHIKRSSPEQIGTEHIGKKQRTDYFVPQYWATHTANRLLPSSLFVWSLMWIKLYVQYGYIFTECYSIARHIRSLWKMMLFQGNRALHSPSLGHCFLEFNNKLSEKFILCYTICVPSVYCLNYSTSSTLMLLFMFKHANLHGPHFVGS